MISLKLRTRLRAGDGKRNKKDSRDREPRILTDLAF
jgi:hypothetical protein